MEKQKKQIKSVKCGRCGKIHQPDKLCEKYVLENMEPMDKESDLKSWNEFLDAALKRQVY